MRISVRVSVLMVVVLVTSVLEAAENHTGHVCPATCEPWNRVRDGPVVFIHIPKAAGTSVRALLMRAAKDKHLKLCRDLACTPAAKQTFVSSCDIWVDHNCRTVHVLL